MISNKISEIKPYSLPENAARIFRLGLTQRQYQNDRNDAIERNFGQVYHPWNAVRDYCKTKCRPVIHSEERMTWSSVQDNLDHQISRQLEINPSLESTIVARAITGSHISNLFEWGMDGCSDNR